MDVRIPLVIGVSMRHDVDVTKPLELDDDRCYRACRSRDDRFDGWFYVAVRTTGIYCRPSCPAVTPKRSNVDFYRSAAGAQQNGFRACKRCRPDAAPGSPEWDLRGDLVGRAMQLVADGMVDREGVSGLADRLGYSSRHLNRLLASELGAGPLALARAQRSQTARILIETTDMPMSDVAFASGFGSIRQFNDTIRSVFASSPTELRQKSDARLAGEAGTVSVRLATRQPFAGAELFAFLGARAIPGVEHWDGEVYERTLSLPHGHGVVEARLAPNCVMATFRLAEWRDLAPAVQRVRRLFDLDADAAAIDEALLEDMVLSPLVTKVPGLRAAGSADPFETLIRAIVGQQVSVAGARTVTGRIVGSLGEPLAIVHDRLTHVFPRADAFADADPEAFPMPRARGATLQRVARRVRAGRLALDPACDRSQLVEELTAVRGIGPWTAGYVLMRGFGDPDVFLSTDLAIRHALNAFDLDADAADAWRPWRTYAMHHLWASL